MGISRREFLKSSAGAGIAAAGGLSPAAAKAIADAQRSGWKKRNLETRPNIAIVVLDDVGFGDLGCYGSEIETHAIDALAKRGVRFNNFHVTALCAPTRACLFSGKNAHSVGVGNIAEWGREYPGYRGWIRESVEILPEMLGDARYSTTAIGKWHLSMVNDQDAMGPFDHWPVQRGFDHWYGFHGSAVDHFHPELFKNTAPHYPAPNPDYHLTDDLVDQSINYITDHMVAAPDRPFFLYLALGACHFPLHAPDVYLKEQRGRYSQGWDAVRASRFSKQQQLGIVPPHAQLAPRNGNVKAWDTLSDDERRYSARTQEAYAAMLKHTDDQLKRFVDFLESQGQLDNTILIVMSDNGAAGSAPTTGLHDVRRNAYINKEPFADRIRNIDKVGGKESQVIYGPGWGQAGNTPLKLYKGDTYEGGTKAPMIIHWPAGKLAQNSISSQYHHAVDVAPTLLEILDEPFPIEKNGLNKPFDGISFAYCLDHTNAPTKKRKQHYETSGDRAMWQDGWKAVALHKKGERFEDDQWALYHSAEDFSEMYDLSAQFPDKLKELKALWHEEAKRNDVLPLDDDLNKFYQAVVPKPRKTYVFYPGATRLNRLSAPDLSKFGFNMTASVQLADSTSSGVLLASGDSMSGYEWIVNDGYVEFIYIYTRDVTHIVRAKHRLKAGSHTLELRGRKAGQKGGRQSATSAGGTHVDLYTNGEPMGSVVIPAMWALGGTNAGVRCGENRGAPISFRYSGANVLRGNWGRKSDRGLEKVVVTLDL